MESISSQPNKLLISLINRRSKKMTIRGIEWLIIFLMLSSSLSVVIYKLIGQSKQIIISPQLFEYSSIADSDYNALGLSQAVLSDDSSVNCQLEIGEAKPPYCGININLEKRLDAGLDLSMFHTLHLDVDLLATPQGQDEAIKLYLRNHNSAYSETGKSFTRKYNGLSYHPGNNKGSIALPLDKFQVMTWWSENMDLDLEYYGTEFNNVTSIELSFIHHHQAGNYQLRINSASLEGYYIYPKHFYFCLVGIWFMVLASYLLIEYLKVRRNNESFKHRLQEIETVNLALSQQAKRAELDELTGVLNRHGAKQWIKQQANISSHQRCAIIYLDLDNFKHVNDRFGHTMGDKVLTAFAATVSSQLNTALLSRWGGEEFIIFCPSMSIDKASELAARLLQHIHHYPWPHGEPQTCSMGIAEEHIDDIELAMSNADDMLYKAKQAGRNRVEVFEGE